MVKKDFRYQTFKTLEKTKQGYIFTIAGNTTLSLLRKRISDIKSKEQLKNLQQIDAEKQLINEIQFKDSNNIIKTFLRLLTPRQKEIYLLSRKEGFTHKEISPKLHISESTVIYQLVAILKYLKVNIIIA